jgi:endonuclease III
MAEGLKAPSLPRGKACITSASPEQPPPVAPQRGAETLQRRDEDGDVAGFDLLDGAGEKVANCALLFGFGRVRAFPIDVWIERVLRELYFPRKRKVTADRLREFAATYFGPYGGYAQQYLFHHARMTWRGRGVEKNPRSF